MIIKSFTLKTQKDLLLNDTKQKANLVLLKRVSDVFEAHAIKSYLESHGILAFLPDEQTISTATHLRIAVGDVRIMVYKDNFDNAADLLRIADANSEETKENIKPASENSLFSWFVSIIITLLSGVPTPLKFKKRKNDDMAR